MINWWPTFDVLATYGHIFNNMVIIYIAIYCNISLFMCLNIFCVCLNYARCTLNLNVIAKNYYVQFGVLNQVDLKMANMVTKKYKTAASFEYLRIRQQFWRIQVMILVLVCIIGFPSTLIQVERAKLMSHDNPNPDAIKSLDKLVFICYIIGFYKDPEGKESANDYFYISMAILFFGLVIEKIAINWLTDRLGCDYFRLQKFIELEQRYDSIVNNTWQAPQVPKYDVDSYKKYYYHQNFGYLKERFIQDHAKQEENRKKFKTQTKNQAIEGLNSNINFVPHAEAVRIKECIKFCLQLKGQDIELNLSEEEKEQIEQIELQKEDDFDGEEIDEETVLVLKNYKLKELQSILVQNVNRKYKISFFKGCQFAIEGFILLLLMISVVLKANVFSIIYLFFIVKYLLGRAKAELLVRLNLMISVTFALQYLFYLLNITAYSNPQPFPAQMRYFPQTGQKIDGEMKYFPYQENEKFQFGFPAFFQASVFQDMKISYMLGIGIETDQLQNLVIDYIIMYMVTMFIMIYRNPILFKGVEKVFWQFPSMTDEQDKWARLDENVRNQVKWMLNPLEWDARRYQGLLDDLGYNKMLPEKCNPKTQKEEIKYKKIAKFQYEFAKEYDDQAQDLNDKLIQYIDIKYDTIWSDEFIKEKKREFKNLSLYFRLVKQGSILVYLTFHIITIMIVLLMATMRQSIFSLGYVMIIVYNVKQGSKVLIQRDQSKHKERNNMLIDLEESKEKYEAEQKKLQPNKKLLKELKDEKESLQIKLNILENAQDVDWSNNEDKEWKMKTIVERYLLLWAIFDFVLQIIAQLPIVPKNKEIEVWGFRKIWSYSDQSQISYNEYENLLKQGDIKVFLGLEFNNLNFLMQCMNCFMISFLSMQAEIFKSPGYKKFITQKGGSMDLLMEIAPLKAKSIAYTFNNQKIRRIINIQRRKETINKTVEELKKRLIYWRKKTQNKLGVYKDAVIEEYNESPQSDADDEAQEDVQLKKEEDANQKDLESPTKGVAFEDLSLEKQLIKQFEEKEKKHKREKLKLMSPEESEQLQKQLCMEFIKAKKEKMNIYCQFYFWMQDTFVNKILFKNTRELLEPILKTHAEGQYFIPTELESIMLSETTEMMSKYYGHREGSKELKKILQDSKRTKTSLLENDQFFKTVKLKDMKRTWEFTRPSSMIFKLIEVFYYAIISNTQTLIYVMMIMSIYQNAGILSVIYPILVFGYALLEETRPRVWFWEFIRNYNQVVILIKFVLNLSIFEQMMQIPSVVTICAYIKPGVYNYTHLQDLLPYMLPEILIMALIMLNEINLKLCGLYTKIEADIETITEGIERNIEKGDQEAVHRKKVLSRNMMMNKYFYSMEQQVKNIEQIEKEMQGEDAEDQYYAFHGLNSFKQSQISIIQQTSKGIWKSSKEFDIDVSANNTSSDFDWMIQENILKKSLENDNLIIFEGEGQNVSDSMFISKTELKEEIDDENERDNLSAGDFDDDFDEKNYVIEGKDIPKKGFFENNPYFNTLFPSLKIQKPGEDYYGQTTFILVVILIYIIVFWSNITVDPGVMLKSVKDSSKIFNGFMSIMAISTIFVIVLERYVNRCDTKAVKSGSIDEVMNTGGDSFFNKQEMGFQQQSTQRSMTLKLQTIKTTDIDVQAGGAQEFLKAMYGGDDGVNNFDDSRTKITFAQRTKYVMHQIIVYVIHALVFWYIPIQGNQILFGSPQCKNEEQCRDFDKNGYLRFYYVIVCLYMYFSACQIREGFPILKKPSSVLGPNESIVGMLKAQIFAPIPFITELRCLFDFTFSKTSLDMFQFMQLFSYHIEMFINKAGNWSYTYKILGSKTEILDKIIFGWLIGGVVLFFLITPLYFFSDAGTFIEPNTVDGGQLAIQFLIQKNITICEMLDVKRKSLQANNARLDFSDFQGLDEEAQSFLENMNKSTELFDSSIPEYCKSGEKVDEKYRNLHQNTPYEIYRSKNPGIRTFDDILFKASRLSQLQETRFFKPKQIQEAYFQETSDVNWLLSRASLNQLVSDLKLSLKKNPVDHEFKLRIHYLFDRIGPPDAVQAINQQEVSFNSSRLSGCQTRNQILKAANLNCVINPTGSQDIIFYNAYNPNLVLGSSKNIGIMLFDETKEESKIMQNHDLKLTFSCPDEWYVQYNTYETKLFIDPEVDFEEGSCKIKDPSTYGSEPDLQKMKKNDEDQDENIATPNWSRIRFILLSMMISSGIFAGYNVITFYTLVVLVLGRKIRPIFLFNFWKGPSYETQDPDAFIKLVEACYMRRHEEDLIGEEECYRMLQEFVRSPELFKAICGSSMKGTIDPKLDRLTEDQRKKLSHLDMLEKKGFEVQKLREDIMKQSDSKDDLDELINDANQENREDQ